MEDKEMDAFRAAAGQYIIQRHQAIRPLVEAGLDTVEKVMEAIEEWEAQNPHPIPPLPSVLHEDYTWGVPYVPPFVNAAELMESIKKTRSERKIRERKEFAIVILYYPQPLMGNEQSRAVERYYIEHEPDSEIGKFNGFSVAAREWFLKRHYDVRKAVESGANTVPKVIEAMEEWEGHNPHPTPPPPLVLTVDNSWWVPPKEPFSIARQEYDEKRYKARRLRGLKEYAILILYCPEPPKDDERSAVTERYYREHEPEEWAKWNM